MFRYLSLTFLAVSVLVSAGRSQEPPTRRRSDPPVIRSSWDDLLEGVETLEDWQRHKETLRKRYLELIRDDHKPPKPPLDL